MNSQTITAQMTDDEAVEWMMKNVFTASTEEIAARVQAEEEARFAAETTEERDAAVEQMMAETFEVNINEDMVDWMASVRSGIQAF